MKKIKCCLDAHIQKRDIKCVGIKKKCSKCFKSFTRDDFYKKHIASCGIGETTGTGFITTANANPEGTKQKLIRCSKKLAADTS